MSKPFTLNVNDVLKAVVVAVLVAAIGGIQQMLTIHGFDFISWDWGLILNLSLSAAAGYLTKNFISAEDGRVLTPIGRIG